MASKSPETLFEPRKKPLQKRSKATVQAILEATARVLLEQGYDRASTNRIAAVAGVSVGSLYQYFSNKEALLMALAELHSGAMLERLGAVGRTLHDNSIPDTVRAFVQAMLAAHSLRPELHRVVMAQMVHLWPERVRELEQTAITLVTAHLQARSDELIVKDLEMAAFVLVTAVEAITHRAVLDAPHLLKSPALENEICDLVLRYIIGSSEATGHESAAEQPAL